MEMLPCLLPGVVVANFLFPVRENGHWQEQSPRGVTAGQLDPVGREERNHANLLSL